MQNLQSLQSLINFGSKTGNPVYVYGVSWNKSSSPTLTRTDNAIGMVANAGVGSTPVRNDFDGAQIYKDISEVTDASGNVFIRIPKFYIKKTSGATVTWQISTTQFDGFYLPKCFWNFTTSEELPYVDVGKYLGSVSADNKLQSLPNTYPKNYTSIVNFRTYAKNNGASYHQLDIHVIDVLQTLFIVEFATLNSQSIMRGFDSGQYTSHTAVVTEADTNRIIVANATADLYYVGQSIGTSHAGLQDLYGRVITAIDVYDVDNKAITFDGTAVNIATGDILYNIAWKNGFSSEIVSKSGSLTSNTDGLSPMSYRGIENLYGNIWQFVDGLNINDYQGWICEDQANYASNVFESPYIQLDYVNANTDGNPRVLGLDANYPYINLPITLGGSLTSYYCDGLHTASGQRIARFGGWWRGTTNDGLFFWGLLDLSTFAGVNATARLVRKNL